MFICDDEKKQRSFLKNILVREAELRGIDYSIYQFEKGEDVIRALKDEKPSVIFLDIEMEGIDGVQTAREIRRYDRDVLIVFVTGFSEYVFDGYEVDALNYILKPYHGEKIQKVFDQIIEKLQHDMDRYYVMRMGTESLKKNLNEIVFFESCKRKVKALTSTGEYEFYEKLDNIQHQLEGKFIRIHQRYLVNMKMIESVSNKEVMVGKMKLPISRGRQAHVNIEFARAMLRM